MISVGKPVIAITMGDAAGIGSEIIAKALCSKHIYSICRPLVVGEYSVMKEAIKLVNKPLKLHVVETATDVQGQYGVIDLLDLHNLNLADVVLGQVSAACGK